MLREFRHTLFLLLQVGVVLSGAVGLLIQPDAWPAIGCCVAGSILAAYLCERYARGYLSKTLGRLRRAAEDIGHGRNAELIEAQFGDDFYKLVNSINLVALRLADASREERRLHDELRRRERLAFLGELAASVAHEVNNPLDGLQNAARILRRSPADSTRAAQMLDLIDEGLERIELIVRRLLTLARENVIRPIATDITRVVESAGAVVANKMETRGVALQRDYNGATGAVMADPHLLEQVFVNLYLNAIDSMGPSGGVLNVRVRRERAAHLGPAGAPDVICVDVADTGSGIAADVLPHIFEPFFTTKGGGRGTGLGLAVAARIIDAHRGSVDVAPREGGGTVFTVRLPGAGHELAPASARENALPGESR